MVFHIQLDTVTATNAAYWSNPVANPAEGAELLAYVDYLGQALLTQVDFTVNGNPLDTYNSEVMNFHQKFFVTPNKIYGWNRNVGQEIPNPGFENVNNANGRFGRGAGVRQNISISDGPQTPQPTQPLIDLWIPMLFWFNLDPRLSIPSVSIPYGQRFININFANANQILQHLHAYDPSQDAPGNNPVPVPDIPTCELWINNIFVNPEIHDIFIKRIGFSLIRVHRLQVIRVNKASDNLLLNQLKWPIETLYFGMRPTDNIDVTSTLMLTGWDLYCQVANNTVDLDSLQNGYSFASSLPSTNIAADDYTTAFVSFTGLGLDFAADLGVTGTTILSVTQLNAALTNNGFPPLIGTFANPLVPLETEITAALPGTQCQATYQSLAPTMDTIEVDAHGVPLYRTVPVPFFNQYVPYVFGGNHINTPYDIGALMLTFNLYPGSYQPSGHVNISRAREFYLIYVSSVIGSTVAQADLSIVALALNFLLISDGSAVLRYST
jgi:hypothetical protein